MKGKNYVAPCLTFKTFDIEDVLTASTEYGVSWEQAGWGGASSSDGN